MAYDDEKVRELTARAIDRGFRAFKLKVGSADESRDLRRAAMLRELVGDGWNFDVRRQPALEPAGRKPHVPRTRRSSSRSGSKSRRIQTMYTRTRRSHAKSLQ